MVSQCLWVLSQHKSNWLNRRIQVLECSVVWNQFYKLVLESQCLSTSMNASPGMVKYFKLNNASPPSSNRAK